MKRKLFTSAALLFAYLAGSSANASTLTFFFATTVDASGYGGASNAPFIVEYSFADDLALGSGPFATNATTGSYGQITGSLTVGSETVTFDGPGSAITVFNDGGGEDGYDVRAESFVGTILSFSPTIFRFLIRDIDSTMFSDTLLPRTTAFALAGDEAQFELDLDRRNRIGGSATAFSLTTDAPAVVPLPAALPLLASGLGGIGLMGWWRRRRRA